MVKWSRGSIVVSFIFLLGLVWFCPAVHALDQKVYDEAGLLDDREAAELEKLATELGAQWETDFLILTTNDTGGRTIEEYMGDFYDEKIEEQGLSKWNATILALDMGSRNLYLAGFYKAKVYIDDARVDRILDQITPKISDGNYYEAFQEYIELAEQYMDSEPANILMQWWLQIIISLVVGGVIVGAMAYQSGGRITVNNHTYMDAKNSRVLRQKDDYVRTTVTKVRKPKQNNHGGGTTKGGHTYSGGGRSF